MSGILLNPELWNSAGSGGSSSRSGGGSGVGSSGGRVIDQSNARTLNLAKPAPPQGLCLEHVYYEHY